ncbi:hypothetical protein BT69DRAFT_1346929 [Atractiella rhizophila]|nr:hypothetical protein BT69DRAFT_1346929 [Atractiella rhizophila]
MKASFSLLLLGAGLASAQTSCPSSHIPTIQRIPLTNGTVYCQISELIKIPAGTQNVKFTTIHRTTCEPIPQVHNELTVLPTGVPSESDSALGPGFASVGIPGEEVPYDRAVIRVVDQDANCDGNANWAVQIIFE